MQWVKHIYAATVNDNKQAALAYAQDSSSTKSNNKVLISLKQTQKGSKKQHMDNNNNKTNLPNPIANKNLLCPLELPDAYTAHGIEWYFKMPKYNINNWRTDRDWYMKTNQEWVRLC